jgi:hypothetical protein
MITATARDWSAYLAAGEAMKQKAQRVALRKVYYRLAVWVGAGYVLSSFTSPFERTAVALLLLLLSKAYGDSRTNSAFLAVQTFWMLSYGRRVRPLRGREVQEFEQDQPWHPNDPTADEGGRPYADDWLEHELSTIESDLVTAQRQAAVSVVLVWVEFVVLVGVLLYSAAQIGRV